MCLIYIEETPCKYLSLKPLDRKDEIPYQNGGQTDTHTHRHTHTQTHTHTDTQNLWNLEVLTHLKRKGETL